MNKNLSDDEMRWGRGKGWKSERWKGSMFQAENRKLRKTERPGTGSSV